MGLKGLDVMMVGRIGWMTALILAAGIRFNSGLQPWAMMIFVVSGTFMAFLIVTRWCERNGSFWHKVVQIFGEVVPSRANASKSDRF